MAKFKGFGQSSKSQLTQPFSSPASAASSPFDLEAQVELWNAGLWRWELPQGMQPRALTPAEIAWLDQVAQAEYLDPEEHGLRAIFYTAPPPTFEMETADWYLRPDWYWNRSPLSLAVAMQQFPIEQFQLTTSGQTPGFYPETHSGYTMQQEQIMRQIFRETVRIGWSLPDYKWYVMEQFHKTTATVTEVEAQQILVALQKVANDRA